MKRFFRVLKSRENGNAVVLVAIAMGGILTLAGLVIDGGHLFMSKSHLQKTANAAALSGAQEIVNDQDDVDSVVNHVLESHGETESLLQSTVENNQELHVELEKEVPLFFSPLFGMGHIRVNVDAKAGLYPMGEAKGVVPLGIDESVPLYYGETYQLKVDAGDSTSGNFGVLALEGPGAKSYEESLTYGFDEKLKVGDIVSTQTGNIAGPTRNGIDYRVTNCPDGEVNQRDCSRVMLVIVYKPYSQSSNQLKSVEITGFAYFYITEPMAQNDDSISGIFIKRAGAGTVGEEATPDRGAYAIRLIE
ncbi:Putative Flp pilus-assembly TadE/G-like [Halobacillus dabanensis]|uniref:Putative Flp pilus-assembly TadE/G-like n=1 Tax=Halobacillus dabanensis TaxID=240302 RepID=A0A1I3WCF3_HALDA|nr:Tad domain-containing protein [Halobacillus dabanensis]SFK04883.1 Putative Flp pilus-assembly TadE/G-like [Halobacillus dabanensis]